MAAFVGGHPRWVCSGCSRGNDCSSILPQIPSQDVAFCQIFHLCAEHIPQLTWASRWIETVPFRSVLTEDTPPFPVLDIAKKVRRYPSSVYDHVDHRSTQSLNKLLNQHSARTRLRKAFVPHCGPDCSLGFVWLSAFEILERRLLVLCIGTVCAWFYLRRCYDFSPHLALSNHKSCIAKC